MEDDLRRIFRSLSIENRFTFSLATIHVEIDHFAQALGKSPIVESLTNTLYAKCYIRKFLDDQFPAHGRVIENLAAELRSANTGRDTESSDWIIERVSRDGSVFVRKGNRERFARAGSYLAEDPAASSLEVGDRVVLYLRSDSVNVQRGYYHAFGETPGEPFDHANLVRMYFNVDPDCAVRLVHAVTSEFNRYQIPFQLKTPVSPSSYGRSDAAVVYVGIKYCSIVLRLVRRICMKVETRPATPLFTKFLHVGVGGARDPGSGESFGMHRCRLVAQGVVDAWERGQQDIASRLSATSQRFASAGVDFRRPWLAVGDVDIFDSEGTR